MALQTARLFTTKQSGPRITLNTNMLRRRSRLVLVRSLNAQILSIPSAGAEDALGVGHGPREVAGALRPRSRHGRQAFRPSPAVLEQALHGFRHGRVLEDHRGPRWLGNHWIEQCQQPLVAVEH